jgi:hypothetical protein
MHAGIPAVPPKWMGFLIRMLCICAALLPGGETPLTRGDGIDNEYLSPFSLLGLGYQGFPSPEGHP